MNLGEANKLLWLWLHQRGGYWTAEQIAIRTGYSSQNIFRALHDMSRRRLIEQVDAAPGEHRKRYGVTDTCLVPLGLTVEEVMKGEPVAHPQRPPRRQPAASQPGELTSAERAYTHREHTLGAGAC